MSASSAGSVFASLSCRIRISVELDGCNDIQVSNVARFTIVTPSLNQCAYIEETIRSVIEQEGPFEIEYFIMDGGSTDGSVEIIRKYADEVNCGHRPLRCAGVRVHWRSEKDSGQSDAINAGLRQASGSFAAYINSDDPYMSGAFAKVAKAFADNPKADFIFGDGEVIDAQGRLQWEWLSRPYNHRVMTSYHFLWNDFTNYIMQQATFWRTRVHSRIGLFDESFHYAMDVEYWVRAGAAGLVLHHLPEKLARFRMIQGTKSLSGRAVFWSDSLEIIRRYRGAKNMAIYLAYYYFNLAKHNGWDLSRSEKEAEPVFQRWESLSVDERRILRRERTRARSLACLLIANALQKLGDRETASIFLREGLAREPRAVLRPAGFYPLVKHIAGPAGGAAVDRITERLIRVYRARRFDYRYHRNA